MTQPQYQVIVLGDATKRQHAALADEIEKRLEPFELSYGEEVQLLGPQDLDSTRNSVATCAVYFGGSEKKHVESAERIRRHLTPMIPVLQRNQAVASCLPSSLKDLNVSWLDHGPTNFERLGTSILENLKLVREQRHVFISYRRTESARAAIQLHDEFTHRGFDVFLDTHSIRAGEIFQEVLWHRLCDSDVLVMLDTPSYFESRWTREELGKARAKEIKVLRVIWPSADDVGELKFSEDIYLKEDEVSETGSLSENAIEEISKKLEDVRSRSIAARSLSIAGKFRAALSTIGAEVVGVGLHRSIKARLEDGRMLTAYPAVGVPSAQTINSVETLASTNRDNAIKPLLIYDHTGIGPAWEKHLKWLDAYVLNVELIDVSRAAWEIIGRIEQ